VPILIDGHNLIGRMSALSLEDPDDEEKLIRILKSYRARTGKAITVVFDPGTPFSLAGSHREGGLEVVFAPHGSTADAVIVRRMERSRNPHGWLVVTSDVELAGRVARRGARVQSSDEFASELAGLGYTEPDQADVHLTPEEVEAWLSLFEEKDGKDDVDRAD
jgi:predicted RNA-binding protein with PIN domain